MESRCASSASVVLAMAVVAGTAVAVTRRGRAFPSPWLEATVGSRSANVDPPRPGTGRRVRLRLTAPIVPPLAVGVPIVGGAGGKGQ
jgi:hypothetical protein